MNSPLDIDLQLHDHRDINLKVRKNGPNILELSPNEYPGGIAIWGALPAVINTTNVPNEYNGVHVHARAQVGGKKQIDNTFDIVRVQAIDKLGGAVILEINGEDAANYNISTIFGLKLKYLICPSCRKIHSDKGKKALTYHRFHQCEHCGKGFFDKELGISNAIMLLKEACNDEQQFREIHDPVDRTLNVQMNEFKHGIQVWGSNPAVLWTSSKLEEGGIHFHGFQAEHAAPELDDTFGKVTINNITLDPEMTRYLMAQKALPYLNDLVLSLRCDKCGKVHFDKGGLAFKPHRIHYCENCYSTFASPGKVACVSNPLALDIKILMECLR